MLRRIVIIVFIVTLLVVAGWKEQWPRCRKAIGLSCLALLPFASLPSSSIAVAPVFAAAPVLVAEDSQPNTLQAQLQILRTKVIEAQKNMIEGNEQELLSKHLAYPVGKLIAAGSVTLETPATKNIYPYGLSNPTDLDPQYASPSASMFILGVGRSGGIIAAKRIPLHATGGNGDVTFPYTFELTSSDLVPPMTEEMFKKGGDIKDDVALTALITKGDKIAEFTGTERTGYGVSEPRVFAGTTIRSFPRVAVGDTLVKREMYTEKEIATLGQVDQSLSSSTSSGGGGGELGI
eukprot:gene26385-31882_t